MTHFIFPIAIYSNAILRLMELDKGEDGGSSYDCEEHKSA